MHLSFLLLSLLVSAASSQSPPSSSSNDTSIYTVLADFALPPGIFPDSVTSFSISTDGRFNVQLSSPCYAHFDYLVYYDSNITGVLSYGGIDDLNGIKVRKFLVWFDVDGIRVDLPPSDYIYFEVGWITKKLTVDQFETVHSCWRNKLWEETFQLSESEGEMNLLVTE